MNRRAAGGRASDERDNAASAAPPEPPSLADRRAFRRELTPTWLTTAVLLAGHRPPDLSAGFRVAYLGCAGGTTAAVVAAVHPEAEVWMWSRDLGAVEDACRLRERAELHNLRVQERADLPLDLGGGLVDVVVVDGVLDASSDDVRRRVLDAIGASLRPGGVVCVAYRTTVGWSECVPVQRLLQYLVRHDPRPPTEAIVEARTVLARLRDAAVGYVAERPVVGAWVDEVLRADPSLVLDECVARDLRPISHAELTAALRPMGCVYAGSACLGAGLPADTAPALVDAVAAAGSPVLEETFRDLALRSAERVDLFRLGAAPLLASARTAALDALVLTAPGIPSGAPPCGDPEEGEDGRPLEQLAAGPVSVAALDVDPSHLDAVLSSLVGGGRAHPVVAGGLRPESVAAARRLNALLATRARSERVLVAPLIGSAVPATPRPSRSDRARLGIA